MLLFAPGFDCCPAGVGEYRLNTSCLGTCLPLTTAEFGAACSFAVADAFWPGAGAVVWAERPCGLSGAVATGADFSLPGVCFTAGPPRESRVSGLDGLFERTSLFRAIEEFRSPTGCVAVVVGAGDEGAGSETDVPARVAGRSAPFGVVTTVVALGADLSIRESGLAEPRRKSLLSLSSRLFDRATFPPPETVEFRSFCVVVVGAVAVPDEVRDPVPLVLVEEVVASCPLRAASRSETLGR
jgi:hypothetical protein